MKLRNKSKLVWNNGYITTKKGKLVALPDKVQNELDLLEVMVEKNFHEQEQPKPADPEPFERMGSELPLALRVETPLLDQKVEESKALMKELDEVSNAKRLLEVVNNAFPNLARFVVEDEFIPGTCVEQLNLPMIENPLELDQGKFLAWVLATFFVEVDDE